MNNSLLPLLSSSQFRSFGSDENNEMNMDTDSLLLMDNIISFYDSSFCLNTGACNNHYQFSETYNSLPFQPQIKFHQPGEAALVRVEKKGEAEPLIEMDYLANYSQPSSFSNKIHNITHHQFDLKNPTNTRKRSAQVGTPLTKNKKFHYGHQDNNNNNSIIQVNESEAKQILTSNRVPVKKSQRLSDKITALQKLVSPYGKTDTASVLEEASISIKLLHDQINDLFCRRNNFCTINNQPLHLQKIRENEGDLRERELCLVPLSVTRELTNDDHF